MPRLLDLFCGAGGCATGYHRAGFDEIVGVDHKPMPRFPFEFSEGDAIEYLDEHGREFDAIHASPPCQNYSAAMRHLSNGAPRLIDTVREHMDRIGKPWIIENVEGAPLSICTTLFGEHGVKLCGTQFGLRIWRHRLFETSFPVRSAGACRHDGRPINPHCKESRQRMRDEFGTADVEKVWREHVGVPWMSRQEGRQAIPPVFTEYIGLQLRAWLWGFRVHAEPVPC